MKADNKTKKEWFETWFDSKYYHILYQHRNDLEAETFINALLDYLSISKGVQVVDLACGKGRHSRQLHSHNLLVDGLDLSENSINEAQESAKEGLTFHVHDMRNAYKDNYAQIVFNLFTSFGYFDNEEDNLTTLKHVYNMLKNNGILVIDYLNPGLITKHFPIAETKTIKNIEFHIKKHCDDAFIYKDIAFNADSNSYSFQEKVQKISNTKFQNWLSQTGFKIDTIFGDYKLNSFDENLSPRQIIIAHK